jgi:hypothetical protein
MRNDGNQVRYSAAAADVKGADSKAPKMVGKMNLDF